MTRTFFIVITEDKLFLIWPVISPCVVFPQGIFSPRDFRCKVIFVNLNSCREFKNSQRIQILDIHKEREKQSVLSKYWIISNWAEMSWFSTIIRYSVAHSRKRFRFKNLDFECFQMTPAHFTISLGPGINTLLSALRVYLQLMLI